MCDLASTCVALGSGRAACKSVSTETPENVTPSFDQVVTQWMSPSKVEDGSAWISSQVHVCAGSGTPAFAKAAVSRKQNVGAGR